MGELRDYQRAILEALLDGHAHSRESLIEIGARACSPAHALAMYQRAQRQPQRQETRNLETMKFEGLSTEERLLKITQQQVLGAKMQASKALSHLVDRKLIEATSSTVVRSRLVKDGFVITPLGRERLAGDDPKAPARSRASGYKAHPLSPEQRRERSRKTWETRRARGTTDTGLQNLSKEERLQRAQKAAVTRKARGRPPKKSNMTPEQASERVRKGWEARRANGNVEEAVRKAKEALTPEQRRQRSLKAWETRRMNQALRTNQPLSPAEIFERVEQARVEIYLHDSEPEETPSDQ